MTLGGYISTAGHAGLIGFILIGPGFESEPLPLEDVQQVSVISEAAFEALLASDLSPIISPAEPVALTPPEPEAPPAPATPAPDAAVTPQPAPEAPEPAPPEVAPPEPEAPPQAVVTEEIIIPLAPLAPVAPDTIPEPFADIRPNPRPAPRVAPEAVAPPPPDAVVDDAVREAAEQAPEAEAVAEEEAEAAAPEEAATEIVTEAEEAEPSGAVTASLRPRVRPNRPTQPLEPDPAPAQAEAPAPAEEEAPIDPLRAALLEAQETPDAPAGPTGPPLTAGEKDTLRVAVQRCWNVGALSTEALNTTVVVGVDMARDGTPVAGSIRMLSSSGGSAAAAQRAYDAARRAILRCGTSGFDLPREKYDQWKEIEMTFNPEQMRIR